jgi:hypothetical protein
MYSGSTLTTLSGRLLGAHQKIDRAARSQLGKLLPGVKFPDSKAILHFEGGNGPDSIKRKSPGKNEPWHYLQPFDDSDNQLLDLIENHYQGLIDALERNDNIRAAFEAAWLAHAIVDGLTPAHHYPYEEKLVELRSGHSIESRDSVKKKLILPGNSLRHRASNNWKFWGPRGLGNTHFTFEWGVATLILPMRLNRKKPNTLELTRFEELPLRQWFRETAQEVANLELYNSFYESSWTIALARNIRKKLAPTLVKAVTLVWYGAYKQAKTTKQPKKL